MRRPENVSQWLAMAAFLAVTALSGCEGCGPSDDDDDNNDNDSQASSSSSAAGVSSSGPKSSSGTVTSGTVTSGTVSSSGPKSSSGTVSSSGPKSSSGTVTSGTATSETVTSGTATSGTATSETVTSGTATSGTATSETVTSGTATSETATSETATSETVTSGTATSGTATSETVTSGTSTSGTSTSGTSTSGQSSSGTVCVPDCTGRECDVDPVCGTLCGTCLPGTTCNAQFQCEGTPTCDLNGFTAAMDQASTDGVNGVVYEAATSQAEPYDYLNIALFYMAGAGPALYGPGTYVIGSDPLDSDYATCGTCVLAYTGIAGQDYDKTFFATEGVLTIESFGPDGHPYKATLTNARLIEVTIDGNYHSEPVVGGQDWCIESYAFDVPMQGDPPKPPCTSNTECAAPTPVCNLDTGACVECVEATDCPVAGSVCNPATNTCCAPDCSGRVCGGDGCGGSCGECQGAGEVCSADGQCVVSECNHVGFQAAIQTVSATNTSLNYTANSAETDPYDRMRIEIYHSEIYGQALWGPGTLDLAADPLNLNYATCGTCVLTQSDCVTTPNGRQCDKRFMATSGTFTIDSLGVAGEPYKGHLTNVKMVEITLDPATGASSPVPNGETWCIDDYPFTVTLETDPPQRCTANSCTGSKPVCNMDTGLCVACMQDTDCTNNRVCNPATHMCVQCFTNTHCPNGVCVPETNTCCTPDCTGRECGTDGCGGSCGDCTGAGEICAADGQCVVSQCNHAGFAPVEQVAQASVAGETVVYKAFSSPAYPYDQLSIELYYMAGMGTAPQGPGSYDIAADPLNLNYATCGTCVRIFGGVTEPDSPQYYAQSGGLEISSFGPNGQPFAGKLVNVKLVEVTIDDNYNSTPVPNGKSWCLTEYSFSAIVEGDMPVACTPTSCVAPVPYCNATSGQCVECMENGHCTSNLCKADNTCCVPNCEGRVCGDNGCGGSCGSCTGTDQCSPDGQCISADCTPQLILDGSFEAGYQGPWTQASTQFGTPLCTVEDCGSIQGLGPRTGIFWAWFGGVSSGAEEGSVKQTVTIPAGKPAKVKFWLFNVRNAGKADEYVALTVDGAEIKNIPAMDQTYAADYTLVTVDLPATYADGNPHEIGFVGKILGAGTSQYVDDVYLMSGTCP